MSRFPIIFVILAAILAGLLWAIITLPSRPSLRSGFGKLFLGIAGVFFMLLEWKEDLLVFSLTAVAVITATLGMVDLVVAKIELLKHGTSEQTPERDN